MRKPAVYEIPPDPFLEHLDRIQAELSALRDAYVRSKAIRLIESAPVRSEYLTAAEVGRRCGHSDKTVLLGRAGFACLNRARIKDGGSVRYPAALVEIHERNRLTRGKCGNCYEEYKADLEKQGL